MSSKISIYILEENEIAKELSERLEAPFCFSKPEKGFYLYFKGQRLYLVEAETQLETSVDFSKWWDKLCKTNGLSSKSLIARAIGHSTKEKKTIWDLTAGLGKDSLVLAGLGHQVIAFEKSKLVSELLKNGHRVDCENDNNQLKDSLKNLKIQYADALSFLNSSFENPKVIFLDPMYPEKRKASLPKKDMQVLQRFLNEPAEDLKEQTLQLLDKSLEVASERVVLKRPPHAVTIMKERLTHSYASKSVRFDMYSTK